MSSYARPIHTNGKRWLVRWSAFEPPVIVNREDVRKTKDVCELFPPGTPNRTKLIKTELKKRGIIK